ncbi:Gfo/Idh/MocA family protein [Ruoffia sp. FAM 26255]|uniref:Gfo/Idh/MocA family protein n=1 Tax=Ruoffia sp. FAM 26255 TaxID=3259519 RepID=UPI0038893710
MINVGTIGTSWITEQFIKASQLTNLYKIKGIYSRSAYRAKDIATIYKTDYYTDQLNNILFDPEIDLIYIASPNSLHFEQAIQAIKAGKHVIIEKPMFSSVEEWHQAHEEAKRMNVFIFEGALHIHTRNYRRMKQLVQSKIKDSEQPFLGANFNFGQYSSKYMQYRDAMEHQQIAPNVFNLEYSGGALMDLGVYPVYVVLDLFGLPNSVRYNAQKGENCADIFGTILFIYNNFQVSIFISKAVHSKLPSEIYIDDETIIVHDVSRISKVELINKEGQKADVIDYKPENYMYDELMNFAEVINNPDSIHQKVRYEDWKQLSLQVAQTMELLRKSANISFDTEEQK